MDPLASALSALTRRSHQLLELTEAMVRINSHTAHVSGVDQVGELIRSALADTALAQQITRAPGYGAHLCFSSRAADSAPAWLLIGHHDTVFPPGSFEGFHVVDGTAHGPGALDMKGGLAVVMTVLLALHDCGLLERVPLRFVSVGDEEVGSPSSRALLEGLAQGARGALVFEAGRVGDAIVTSRRGSGNAVVSARGKAAHAGNALRDGRNAIWTLAKFVDAAQALNGTIEGTSVNVGLIQGGTARNTVPELARAEIDLRFDDARGEHALTSALAQCAVAAREAVEGTQLDVHVEITRKPWERTEASHALCQDYAACQRAAGLLASEAPRQGGGSDANTLAAQGLPAIDGLGPRGAGFHTSNERIEIASLPLKAEALLRFLLREL